MDPDTDRPEHQIVSEWIADLPPHHSRRDHKTVPNHRASNLSALNLARIKATPVGWGRSDWPKERPAAIGHSGYKGHSDVYPGLRSDQPASALTTRCISFSNGRSRKKRKRAPSVFGKWQDFADVSKTILSSSEA